MTVVSADSAVDARIPAHRGSDEQERWCDKAAIPNRQMMANVRTPRWSFTCQVCEVLIGQDHIFTPTASAIVMTLLLALKPLGLIEFVIYSEQLAFGSPISLRQLSSFAAIFVTIQAASLFSSTIPRSVRCGPCRSLGRPREPHQFHGGCREDTAKSVA
jgi:hypothetical protein